MASSNSKGRRAGGARERNQGEGDKDAARRFNEMEQRFVNSRRGEQAIERAGDVDPDETRELQRAENQGRARARGEDPALTRRTGKDDDESRRDDD